MFMVHSTFRVPEGKEDEVINIYRNRSRLVDTTPGFTSFRLLQNSKRRSEITVEISWESKEAYLNWVRSDQFKKIHELEKKYPDQELASVIPDVTQFEVVIR